MRSFLALIAGIVLVLCPTASADRAYVAHPDPEGTRTLRVKGVVESYELRDGRVTLVAREGGDTCRRIVWTLGDRQESKPIACSRSAAPELSARSGRTNVELSPGASDSPDRLVVNGPNGTRSWPLPERAFHVDVDGGAAIFSTRTSREVYAVDLASGRTALVGLTRRQDVPRLDRSGLLFRDNVFKRLENGAATLMKFIPRSHVDSATRTVGRPLRVDGEIADLAMDGARVALAVRGWHGECDAVLYWNITWRYAIPITEEEERTCTWSRQGGSIESVSIAGLRAAWVMRVGTEERLISASSVDCFERRVVTARTSAGERVVGHSGDANLLAYLVATTNGNVFGKLDGRMRARPLASDEVEPRVASADGDQVAVLRTDGTVQVRTKHGAVANEVAVGPARAIALRGPLLVVLTPTSTVDVYDTRTRERVSTWPVPDNVRARIDAHFGVAVLTGPRAVYALSLASGRLAIVALPRAGAVAAIEAPGIAYARPSTGGTAMIEYVPFARIERLLGL